MERERRYCMRFLRPDVYVDQIEVEVVIQHEINLFQRRQITYTLKERGYPSEPASGRIKDFKEGILSGEEQKDNLLKEWGR
jgi:hypothetical protein